MNDNYCLVFIAFCIVCAICILIYRVRVLQYTVRNEMVPRMDLYRLSIQIGTTAIALMNKMLSEYDAAEEQANILHQELQKLQELVSVFEEDGMYDCSANASNLQNFLGT